MITKQPVIDPLSDIRKTLQHYPELTEGKSCSRTAFKSGGKAFLFVGVHEVFHDLMLKLGPSLEEAENMEAESPDLIRTGAHGWVTLTCSPDQGLDDALIQRWILESFTLLAPKKLVKLVIE